MTQFIKRPLKTKTNTMKKYIYITWAILLAFIVFYFVLLQIQYQTLKQELIGTTQAYEQAIQPSELDELIIELEHNRISRQNDQAEIDKLVEAKKKKAERADEIQAQIVELTWVK